MISKDINTIFSLCRIKEYIWRSVVNCRKVISTVVTLRLLLLEGDKFISVQTAKKEGEKSTEIIREFKGDEMIATSKCIGSDLVCTQVFKKQA